MLPTCSGSLIFHVDGTIAGCTADDDLEPCAGRDVQHLGDPKQCIDYWADGCNHCGIH
jgi:hypothetical protein